MKSNISASSIEKVTGIFNKNGWGVTEHAEEFNRFCQMLENLSSEQQDLILELTQQEYQRIPDTFQSNRETVPYIR
jgi:hypothetical protein